MKSKWYELKPAVIALRRNGKSLTFIEEHLGVPRSTLSGWCKDIRLTNAQHRQLEENRLTALKTARVAAANKRRQDKRARIKNAEISALKSLASLKNSPELIKLALAMLYWGQGKKNQATALGSSDPEVLAFFVSALPLTFGVRPQDLTCEFYLRKGHDREQAISYWSRQLGIPTANFTRIYYDKKRREPRRPNHHGICTVYCHSIEIQRELVYLYKSFCSRVTGKEGD